LVKTQNYGLPMFNRKCVFILKSRFTYLLVLILRNPRELKTS
jgi:hypothetical protein